MKDFFKFGKMKPENIVKGIFICMAIVIIYRIHILNGILMRMQEAYVFMSNLAYIKYYVVLIGIIVIPLILLKLVCEIIYKILLALQVVVDRSKE